jgi:hypothetical protein
LVNWPDTCKVVPTYEQLLDTLEIVINYQESPEDCNKDDIPAIEEWLKKNSITKFKKALLDAEAEQGRLDNIKTDWFEDNRLFPQSYMRGDN